MTKRPLALLAAVALGACDTGAPTTEAPAAETANAEAPAKNAAAEPDIAVTDAELAGNPLVADWDTPFGVPPFGQIKDEHFMPAV
ncbi:MAG: M3 family peptidase, partial [Pseudomonadota bacterium]